MLDILVLIDTLVVAITPERYLRWLQSQFVALGGKRKHMEISSLTDAMDDPENTVDIIVNCAGMHAAEIQGVNDTHINKPVRGQNVIVRAKHIRKTISVKSKFYWFASMNMFAYTCISKTRIYLCHSTSRWHSDFGNDQG